MCQLENDLFELSIGRWRAYNSYYLLPLPPKHALTRNAYFRNESSSSTRYICFGQRNISTSDLIYCWTIVDRALDKRIKLVVI